MILFFYPAQKVDRYILVNDIGREQLHDDRDIDLDMHGSINSARWNSLIALDEQTSGCETSFNNQTASSLVALKIL